MSFKKTLLSIYDRFIYLKRDAYDFFTRKEVVVSVGDIMHSRGFEDGTQLLVASRLLDVEAYILNGDKSFCWQKLMSTCEHEGNGHYDEVKWGTVFENIIKSYQKNGYNGKSHFILDRDRLLRNGTHRSALHLFMGIYTAKAWALNRKYPVFDNSYKRFKKSLPAEAYDAISQKLEEIRGKLISEGVAFCAVLPVEKTLKDYFPDIKYDIQEKKTILLRQGVGLSSHKGQPVITQTQSGQYRLVLFTLNDSQYKVVSGHLVSVKIQQQPSFPDVYVSRSCFEGKTVFDLLKPYFLEENVVS